MKKKKLIIFDLDGVLINSIQNMNHSLNQVSNSLKIKLNFNEYKKYLGLPFEKVMEKIGVNKNVAEIKKKYIYFSYRNIKKISINKKKLSDLKYLRKKFNLAVFTSKDKFRSNKILKKYRIFSYILTSDDVKKGKPHPEGVYNIIKKFGVSKKNTIYVGDSLYDLNCAKRSGVKYCHAIWGYAQMNRNKKLNKIKNLREVEKFL